MTIQELIDHLKQFNPGARISIYEHYWMETWYFELEDIHIDKSKIDKVIDLKPERE